MFGNKHRYTFLRVSRLLFAPVYTLISFFLKKNDNIIVTASFNTEYSDNAKALFEMLVEMEDYKNRVYFVINDSTRRRQLNSLYPGKFISNTSMRNGLFILRANYWFCSGMELPLAAFFQRRIRQSIHLGHGMLYKKIGLMEARSSWYKKIYYAFVGGSFTYSIATTEFCQGDIATGFGLPRNRVLLVPQPKTFQIAFPLKVEECVLSDSRFIHVLYAPTWRPYAAVKLFPFDDFQLSEFKAFLVKNGIHIWLRLHPRFEQDVGEELLRCSNIHLFSSSKYGEINSYLYYFDALITDYSSIYYDFLTLSRPVLFFDYDFDLYSRLVGVIDNYQDVKCTETTASYLQFEQQLLDISLRNFDLGRVKAANKLINYPVSSNMISRVFFEKINLD